MNVFPLTILFFMLFFVQTQAQDKVYLNDKFVEQISTLANQSKIQEAFDFIELSDSKTMQNLITLTEIPSPPFMESKRAKKYLSLLQDAGADSVWMDSEGNVLALRKGRLGKKLVALDAHLDVVFPEGTDVTIKHAGDTLKAPGVGDDTRGLSMVITVLKAIVNSKIMTDSDLLFVGTVGEEGLGDLRGVKKIFNHSNLKIDSWISIDGGDLGRINNAALGSKRYKVVFGGKGGHSWGAFGLGNPHHAMGKAIDYFATAATEFTNTGDRTSFNIGRIGGGTSINSIPFESWMEVDMRSISPKRLNQIEQLFIKSMKSAVLDYNSMGHDSKVSLEIKKIGDRPSGEISSDNSLIQRAIAVSKYFGAKPTLTIGSTNASIPISKNIPAVTIGRGGKAGGAHSLHEWFLNENGTEAIKLALMLLISEAGFSN